jgi:ABC-type branched-subunit amino acid transport system permease subunit
VPAVRQKLHSSSCADFRDHLCLYAIFNGFISPDAVQFSASGDVLIMVMLGGTGTLIGPIIGSGFFLLMKNLVSSYSNHWMLIIGLAFIACVLYFPGGIWGTLRDLKLGARLS